MERALIACLVVAGLAASGCAGGYPAGKAATMNTPILPRATAAKLPRWRGFNLLEKFTLEWGEKNAPYREDDFRMISGWGFNFVRLPMDYRCWIRDGDWRKFDEKTLGEIDQAVGYGKKYGVHVCLNFHRAPGYCVNPPKEPRDLWTDREAQEVFALHWGTFARRFRGVPNENLSFDLVNEPGDIDPAIYSKVMRLAVAAIRKEDPDRLVIADGVSWGNKPVMELADLGIAQSTRGYVPFQISHFRASWIEGSDRWPVPGWPIMPGFNIHLFGDMKPEMKRILAFNGGIPSPAELRVRVLTVSGPGTLAIRADGATVFSHEFNPGPGQGEWMKAVYRKEWDVWQNIYDRVYTAPLSAGAKRVELELVHGDWLTLAGLDFLPSSGPTGALSFRPGSVEWEPQPGEFTIDSSGNLTVPGGKPAWDRERLWREQIESWKKLEARRVGVHVGEWGAFSKTPHAVALSWMRDCLENWRKAGWGWALWNFRGSFGVLDSEREDIKYEDFEGHKLDREMLELLRSH